MFNLERTALSALRSIKRSVAIYNGLYGSSAGMATEASRIGDTLVRMNNLEPGRYINYQRIADNLEVVRSRFVFVLSICLAFAKFLTRKIKSTD